MANSNVLTEGRHPGEAIIEEGNGDISRENAKIPPNQFIEANSLLARVGGASMAINVAATAGNTGDGAVTLASGGFTSKTKDGPYKLTCIEPAANGGVFQLEGPDGKVIGSPKVGVAWNKELKFTIGDGATDFVAGDSFTLTAVETQGDNAYMPYDPTSTTGQEIPAAYSIYACGTGDDWGTTAVIARLATLNGHNIAWPEGITDEQKADAVQALATQRNVIVRF